VDEVATQRIENVPRTVSMAIGSSARRRGESRASGRRPSWLLLAGARGPVQPLRGRLRTGQRRGGGAIGVMIFARVGERRQFSFYG